MLFITYIYLFQDVEENLGLKLSRTVKATIVNLHFWSIKSIKINF